MKTNYLLIFFLFLPASIHTVGAHNNQLADNNPVTIRWNNEKQEIDGFGVSQAGWAYRLYIHYQRDEVMDLLFGDNGLKLNMLRGEVFPHYWENEGDKSFSLEDDINLSLDDPYMVQECDDLKRRGQLWVTKMAKEKYNVNKLMFSAWSPPAYMKSNNAVSNGYLQRKYHQEYANFLTAFCKAYKSIGLEPYAISPSNEPGYPAPWNSSLWTADKMGRFIIENLGPTFKREGISAKIVFGENPFWSVNNQMLASISSLHFVDMIINEYPEIKEYNTVASGHGYPITDEFGPLKAILNTPIVPFKSAEENNIPVWMTEISTTDPLDIGMDNGLVWAENFHKYLTDASINAFIWWAGALPANNNEGLITLDKDRKNYQTSKRFETFGNFTRYIPSGSKRVEASSGNDDLLISAYKNSNNFTLVLINKSDEIITSALQIEEQSITGKINTYLTNADNCWNNGTVNYDKKKKEYSIAVPARSVMTVTGRVK
jgi:O-Glycosyl hydrolase